MRKGERIGLNDPEWKRKRDLIELYDQSFPTYDSRYWAVQFEKYQNVIPDNHPFPRSILDLGCGTGLLLEFLVEELGKRRTLQKRGLNYIGIDFSRKILGIANKKRAHDGYQRASRTKTHISLIQADCSNLPFRDGIAETIASFSVLQNIPDKNKFLGEIQRITKNHLHYLWFSALKKSIQMNEFAHIMEQWFPGGEYWDLPGVEDNLFRWKCFPEGNSTDNTSV